MKKVAVAIVAAVFAVALVGGFYARAAETETPSDVQVPKLMTHGELAQLLVRKLGLYRVLPANPNDLDCMMVLAQNGIYPSATLTSTEQQPLAGWSLGGDTEVSQADLAIVLVRALGLVGDVQGDVADPKNWLDVLAKVEVPADTVGAGVAELKPLGEITTSIPIFQITGEPLVRRYIPESDILPMLDTVRFPDVGVIQPPPTVGEQGPKPKPVTPN